VIGTLTKLLVVLPAFLEVMAAVLEVFNTLLKLKDLVRLEDLVGRSVSDRFKGSAEER